MRRPSVRLAGIIWATICLGAAGPALAASPYDPVLTVNNGVITEYDIEQRTRLLEALGATGDLGALAEEQLTEDRVKVQAAESMGIELPEGAIETGLEEFATTRGLTVDDVLGVLEAREIDRQAMDDFVESGLMWREVIAARFRTLATPSDADLEATLELEATRPQEVFELSEIALPFAERGEAETLALADELFAELSRGASFVALARQYSRSSTAENDGRLEPIPAARLPAAIRPQVLLLRPGQVSRPIPISGGVAILRLNAVRETLADAPDPEDPEAMEALRQRLFAQRITAFGEGYLEELLGDALIVRR